ncbi:MAG: TVP38/TMEM64 family protein [Phycisphaeraceae bacterium]|nr:TVP38/TMEM64 family protein [Phycisphaerae bacterium]MBX3392731.1 TVP38/TMEM64 family protein [Phycisphaeraceae bacterium]HRJ51001.1 VTT domain-containing protein [Phycisphaerales bacterium]
MTDAPSPTPADKAPRHILKALGPAAILGLLWTVFPAILGITLLGFLGQISDFLQSLGPWGWVVYIVVFVISAGVGLLPTLGQSILGGWTFGMELGFACAISGFVGGSMVGYVIARLISQKRIEKALQDHPRGRAVRDALLRHNFWRSVLIITLIRLPPNSPFALTNLVLASSGAKPVPYMLGTAMGMAPRTAIAVWIAAAAASTGAGNLKELVQNQPTWLVLGGLATFVLALSIIGHIGKRALDSVTREKPADQAPATPSERAA